MDKISGIIPSSARVTNVDMKDAPPSRAAIPGADRGVGAMSNIGVDQVPGTPAWKSKEARQASLAAEVSNSFFMKSKPEASESPSAGMKDVPPPPRAPQPEGLFPKGSFIDRSA